MMKSHCWCYINLLIYLPFLLSSWMLLKCDFIEGWFQPAVHSPSTLLCMFFQSTLSHLETKWQYGEQSLITDICIFMNHMAFLFHGSNEMGWDKCQMGQCSGPSCVVHSPGAAPCGFQGSPAASEILLFPQFPLEFLPLESLCKLFLFPRYRIG